MFWKTASLRVTSGKRSKQRVCRWRRGYIENQDLSEISVAPITKLELFFYDRNKRIENLECRVVLVFQIREKLPRCFQSVKFR